VSDTFDPISTNFLINPNYRLQWEEAQQCHVLLYPEGMVKLSDTAVEILKRCEQPQTGNELIAKLQKEFPGADTLVNDVSEFLEHAQQQEWILPSKT